MDGLNPATLESAQFQKQLESLYENPFDAKKLLDLDDFEFD